MNNCSAWGDEDTRPAGLLFKGNENPNLLKGILKGAAGFQVNACLLFAQWPDSRIVSCNPADK